MQESPRPELTPADEEHLRLMILLNKVAAWLFGLGSCGGLPYILAGLVTMTGGLPDSTETGLPVAVLGGISFVAGIFLILLMLTVSVASWKSSQWIVARQKPVHIQVAAAIQCLSVPIGTGLGVFTFIVLSRPQVKALFADD